MVHMYFIPIFNTERHGIHKQKDLSKFYSNLLKNNVSMGAYNVATSSVPAAANEESSGKDSKTELSEDKSVSKKKESPDLGKEITTVRKKEHDETEIVEPKLVELESAKDKRLVSNEDERDEKPEVHEKKSEEESNTAPEVSKKRGEKRNTDEAAQAARERYLARKRLKQSAQ